MSDNTIAIVITIILFSIITLIVFVLSVLAFYIPFFKLKVNPRESDYYQECYQKYCDDWNWKKVASTLMIIISIIIIPIIYFNVPTDNTLLMRLQITPFTIQAIIGIINMGTKLRIDDIVMRKRPIYYDYYDYD